MNAKKALDALFDIISRNENASEDKMRQYLKVIRTSQQVDISEPININTPQDNRDGTTLLMLAVDRAKKNVVSLMLEQNADPNLLDANGDTALDRAIAQYNQIKVDLPGLNQRLFVDLMRENHEDEKIVKNAIAFAKSLQQDLIAIMAILVENSAKMKYDKTNCETLISCLDKVKKIKEEPNTKLAVTRSLISKTKKEKKHSLLYSEIFQTLDTAYQDFLTFFIRRGMDNKIAQIILDYNSGDLFKSKKPITLHKETIRSALIELKKEMQTVSGNSFFKTTIEKIDKALKLKNPTLAYPKEEAERKRLRC